MFPTKNETSNTKEQINSEENEYHINIFRRTLENNTHEVIEDTKIKKVTSWRKSQKKFFQSLILNILTLGIIHIISLFNPNLYIKLYCNQREPKECDFFLVEDIYGKFTLCKKIYKKDKTQNNLSPNIEKQDIISSSLLNKSKKYLTKNLTYSFIYKSVTYEYDEINNEISPVYMNLSNLTCKDIFHNFSEGLSSEGLIKLFFERYGKNEYNLNFKLIYLYFLRIEIPSHCLVIIISLIEFFLEDYISFFVKVAMISLFLIVEFIRLKINVYNLYKDEYTLDGEKHKIKVKRNHKFDEKSELFCEINTCDLLPGDIIFLKSNDIVPCDCIILEGECMANSDNLTGNLNIFLKISLENQNIPFNYKTNMDSILFHGMKIVKTYSNLKSSYISALCINTGPNTYKANLYSNSLYLLERKKEYQNPYKFFGEGRSVIIYVVLALFIISMIVAVIFLFTVMNDPEKVIDIKNKEIKNLLFVILIRVICKSLMPMYYLLNSFIIFFGIINLKKENIYTFDKSKILNSSSIDTLFLNKTGTLCEDKFEINGYHPISINHFNSSNLGFKTYDFEQNKEINIQLVNYYKNYINKQNGFGNIKKNNDIKNQNIEKIKMKNSEYSTIFLECLLSCNNLEKYGMEIFGNPIDIEIFKAMKWDIKADINSITTNQDVNYPYEESDNTSKNINRYDKIINDIFPSNYYKITESIEKEILREPKRKYSLIQTPLKQDKDINNEYRDSLLSNKALEIDVIQSHINSYKLRVYKRFLKEGAFSASSITYNFITRELRFNTKGVPEDILDKCHPFTIPKEFDKIISLYRKKGFIVIICAGRKVNMETYNFYDDEDKYMNDLTFYGFVTLKNNLKSEVRYALNDLKLFNCNFVISSGDDIFNTLPVGFESAVLENKDIYSFDKDDIKNRIIIKKIYSINKFDSEKNEDNYLNQNVERLSKISSNNLALKSINSKLKLSKFYEGSETNLSSLLRDKKINQSFLEGTSTKVSKGDRFSKTRNFKRELINGSISTTKDFLNDNSRTNISFSGKKLQSSKKNLIFASTSRKNTNRYTQDDATVPVMNEKNAILYYYPGIFEDHKELTEDCIYCVNGHLFEYLYQNKDKKQIKKLLEIIHKKCRIYFNMTSISKSHVIDYYREYPNECICTIGECQSDIDPIMTSNIGINLQAPKNFNTILCHYYSPLANLLSIKKIIREGRSIKENHLLMGISISIYTLIINSYIICCFMRRRDIIQGQLNFLEIAFLFLSISAFSSKADVSDGTNLLMQNRKLYIWHYIFQILGLVTLKSLGIYFFTVVFKSNDFIGLNEQDSIYATFYFIFCIEQLFSTIFVLNLICFYRQSWQLNTSFIVISLIIFLYFVIVLTLNNSNFNVDIFNILHFEFLENIVDAYDENNKLECFYICLIDISVSIVYSNIIYYVFDYLSKNKSKDESNKINSENNNGKE